MISRITALMIQTNDVELVDAADRIECWLVKDGQRHALLVSCDLGQREQLEEFIQLIKSGQWDQQSNDENNEL